jgi:glycosyltransferase involved in cell wall biosynthesis
MTIVAEPGPHSRTVPSNPPRGPAAAQMSTPELCLHALAQARDEIELELHATSGAAVDLRMVADAYGLTRRLHFVESTRSGRRCQFADGGSTFRVFGSGALNTSLGELVERLSPGVGGSPISAASDGLLSGQRIVLLTNYPTHYRLSLFEIMARELEAAGARFRVMFLASDARSRPWLTGSELRFDHEFLATVRLPIRHRAPLVPVNLEHRLRIQQPTIVLSAGLSPFVSARAARLARETGSSFGVWSGETEDMASARSSVRRLLRRRLVLEADFAVSYGVRSACFLRGLRPDLPLVIGRNTSHLPMPAPRLIAGRAGGHPTAFVMVGDLADTRKGVDVALAALRLVRTPRIRLSVIGGGRLLPSLAESVCDDDRVSFLGPLAPQDVARELAECDVLLFPTRADVFGLVLVEAMAAGLLPIVSRAAGAVDDLAVDKHNSVVLDGHEPAVWAAAIKRIVADPAWRKDRAEQARKSIESRWSLRHAVGAMIAGLRLGVLSTRKRRTP